MTSVLTGWCRLFYKGGTPKYIHYEDAEQNRCKVELLKHAK